MFFEPYMPELRQIREIAGPARQRQARPGAPHAHRTTVGAEPHEALLPVSRKPFKPAADSCGLIAAVTAAGVVAGFYTAAAIARR
jgi:hypothetical protein